MGDYTAVHVYDLKEGDVAMMPDGCEMTFKGIQGDSVVFTPLGRTAFMEEPCDDGIISEGDVCFHLPMELDANRHYNVIQKTKE